MSKNKKTLSKNRVLKIILLKDLIGSPILMEDLHFHLNPQQLLLS
jgi:hypothetical protein